MVIVPLLRLIQLKHAVSSSELYEYGYRSLISNTMREHLFVNFINV